MLTSNYCPLKYWPPLISVVWLHSRFRVVNCQIVSLVLSRVYTMQIHVAGYKFQAVTTVADTGYNADGDKGYKWIQLVPGYMYQVKTRLYYHGDQLRGSKLATTTSFRRPWTRWTRNPWGPIDSFGLLWGVAADITGGLVLRLHRPGRIEPHGPI